MFLSLVMAFGLHAVNSAELTTVLGDQRVQAIIGDWNIGKITETARWRVPGKRTEIRIAFYGPDAYDQAAVRVLVEDGRVLEVYSDNSPQCGTLLLPKD